MLDRFSTLMHPARFQSAHRRGPYFEGWYFKLVDAEGRAVAFIPGISRSADDSHAFVQAIRPGGRVRYTRYPLDDFRFRSDRFEIALGDNHFTSASLEIDLAEDAAQGWPCIQGVVEFGEWRPWPVTLASPGIMGWYRYVPRMECYHGVLSLDHSLRGELAFGDDVVDFTGGRGYTEKDWGTSFPSSWIWCQSNHFVDDYGIPRPGVSLTTSVARIPWLGSSFIGHITGLLLDDGELMRFATYTGARLVWVSSGDGRAEVVVRDRRYELLVAMQTAESGALKAPRQGAMTAHADEALGAHVRVELRERRSGRVRFAGTGSAAGLEIMDPNGELIP